MTAAIEIKNLSYAYKHDWTLLRKDFLKDINLTVETGEAFGFLGHNGAGKTTTIKLLVGLTKSTRGSMEIFGESVTNINSRNQIGFVPEQPYFYDHIKVDELLRMYGKLKKMSNDQIENEVTKHLEKVKMTHKRKAKLKSLSKGQVQRVAMAQAMLGSPRLYILDEPFSGLDPIGRKEFSDLLFELKQAGATIFVSSHILSDIEFLCDRVAIMSEGQLKGVYSLKDLPEILPGEYKLKLRNFDNVRPKLEGLAATLQDQKKFLYLTFDSWEKAEEALNISVASDAHVEDFRFIHGGLEKLFLDVTNQGN